MGLKPLKRRQKAELKRSRVRSLKCVLLKRMNKKARLNLSAFVWWRGKLKRCSVKQGGGYGGKRLGRELKRKAG
ncbi:hypothetical protein [Campylobacter upsaliensis]|uniref:hypothetical protein n=1 Tax=Campylobacter upsaliensis TaxID=28080 RepID=UPI000312C70A|nr:hypothetical protein [Campylobacter upsaliensis]MCR2110678.1 hypothetical protein [Campylobacter upsaliensis]MCR2116173.1 hypothetical protein [Campylobacter upsaliensis]